MSIGPRRLCVRCCCLLLSYRFQRAHGGVNRSAQRARTLDLGAYLRARLAAPDDHGLRDFQSHRLAMAAPDVAGGRRARALAALERLPFVGLVERFGASLERLEAAARPLFPSFRAEPVHANATRAPGGTLAGRVAELRGLLRARDFAAFEAANQDDLALHAAAARLYGVDDPMTL